MAVKIGGKSKSASKSKTSTKSTTRKAASKPAAKKAAKRGTTAKKSASTKSNGDTTASGRLRRDSKEVQGYVKKLERAGAKRDKALAAHEEAVEEVFELVQEAISAQVPMSIISESVGVSRQWLYKMGEFKDRGNGNGSKRKPAAKKSAAKKGTATKTTSKKRTRIKK